MTHAHSDVQDDALKSIAISDGWWRGGESYLAVGSGSVSNVGSCEILVFMYSAVV